MSPGEIVTLAGYLVGFAVFLFVSRQDGFDRSAMTILGGVGLITGGIGARVAQSLFGGGWDQLLNTQAGGRTILAGVLCGWIGVVIAKRVMGIQRTTGPAFAFGLCAGEAIGRIGCHLNQCCYGKVTTGFGFEMHGENRFPSQLLSSVVAVLMLIFLVVVRRRYGMAAVFPAFIASFATGRFLIEFTRDTSPFLGLLTVAQWVCLEVIASLAIVLVWKSVRKAKTVPQ